MIWNTIINWFNERKDRQKMVNEFNRNAKLAFRAGADVLLQASIAGGIFSNRAFRIKALMGRSLKRQEQKYIGDVVLSDIGLVRTLISLEFTFLEVHDDTGYNGLRWRLWNYAQMGGYLGKAE